MVGRGAFVGRAEQLRLLEQQLSAVRAGGERPGRALLVRGRRRVGKSRLVEEFLERSGVPHVFFTASQQTPAREVQLFSEEVAASDLPGAPLFLDVTPGSWEAALTLVASALPASGPAVVVIDELPYLTAADPGLEGTLQKVFDRVLSRRQVLLVGIGSDLAMMEALNGYGRPFHQRATELVVPPLSTAEVGELLDLEPAEAFDALLVTGGLPLVCQEWRLGATLWEHLEEALSRPTSALLVSGERSLAAEFPSDVQARRVLSTIGSGERTFTAIGQKAGGLQATSLTRSLEVLIAKRVVAADVPLSTKRSRETRYRVSDPHLRFWLAFLGPHLAEVERGRGDRVLERIRTSWTSWRGRAVEPLVRESLARLDTDQRGGADGVVGGYWTRSNDVEVDLVVADRAPVAEQVTAVGSVKWLERRPFDAGDLAALVRQRERVPGASVDTPLLVVSRGGCEVGGVTAIGPEQLLDAWR